MVIQRLYEVLDELVDQVVLLRDEFAESGDLNQLSTDTANVGSTAYTISRKVDEVINALKFNDD